MRHLELIQCEPISKDRKKIYALSIAAAFLAGLAVGEAIYIIYFQGLGR